MLNEVQTSLRGLFVVQRNKKTDSRGSLERLFCVSNLSSWCGRPVRQINKTTTLQKGTIRGLHFQYPPAAEFKLVTCISGSVFDVAVDLRLHSETYGKSFCIELTEKNATSVIIPTGFAHGFQTLSSNVEMLYLHSEDYSPSCEAGVDALDADLAIPWPRMCSERSTRDANLIKFNEFEGIKL